MNAQTPRVLRCMAKVYPAVTKITNEASAVE